MGGRTGAVLTSPVTLAVSVEAFLNTYTAYVSQEAPTLQCNTIKYNTLQCSTSPITDYGAQKHKAAMDTGVDANGRGSGIVFKMFLLP